MVLIRALVAMLGGFWRVREFVRSSYGFRHKCLRIVYYEYLRLFGAYIGHTADFASEPVLPHGVYGIFISDGATIGKNCVIFQHVTVGSNTLVDTKRPGAPRIGDSCYIGSGATIVGNVEIGSNVRIGANATVATNIPNDHVVVSQPSRIIPRAGLNNRYYSRDSKGRWVFRCNGRWVVETDASVVARLPQTFRQG